MVRPVFASEELIRKLAENGQIAAQYVDMGGRPSMDVRANPNGSVLAVEGIPSPDGRIFGNGPLGARGQGPVQNVSGRVRLWACLPPPRIISGKTKLFFRPPPGGRFDLTDRFVR